MALTILQEPTSPNVSSTNLIYTVSSSNVPNFSIDILQTYTRVVVLQDWQDLNTLKIVLVLLI